MATGIISSMQRFYEVYPKTKKLGKENLKLQALAHYFKKGGVVSAVETGKELPKLTYPSQQKLDLQIKELETTIKGFASKKKDWQNPHFQADISHLKNNVMKFTDVLYWQHLGKSLFDQDYKKDAAAVKLPVEMVAEPKYRPMINMFVNNLDYRKNLTETVTTSIVYKKDRRVARYAKEIRSFRMETAEKNLNVLEEKITGLKKEIDTLKILFSWLKD
jgi:hypothetical protein